MVAGNWRKIQVNQSIRDCTSCPAPKLQLICSRCCKEGCVLTEANFSILVRDSCKLSASSYHNLGSHVGIGSPGLCRLCFPHSLSSFRLSTADLWRSGPSGLTMPSPTPSVLPGPAPNPPGRSKISGPPLPDTTVQSEATCPPTGHTGHLHQHPVQRQLLGLSSFTKDGTSLDSGNWAKTRTAAGQWDMPIADKAASHWLFSSAFYTTSAKRGFLPKSDIGVT